MFIFYIYRLDGHAVGSRDSTLCVSFITKKHFHFLLNIEGSELKHGVGKGLIVDKRVKIIYKWEL